MLLDWIRRKNIKQARDGRPENLEISARFYLKLTCPFEQKDRIRMFSFTVADLRGLPFVSSATALPSENWQGRFTGQSKSDAARVTACREPEAVQPV